MTTCLVNEIPQSSLTMFHPHMCCRVLRCVKGCRRLPSLDLHLFKVEGEREKNEDQHRFIKRLGECLMWTRYTNELHFVSLQSGSKELIKEYFPHKDSAH